MKQPVNKNLMDEIGVKENISPHEMYINKPALRKNNGDLSPASSVSLDLVPAFKKPTKPLQKLMKGSYYSPKVLPD
jgi:hypothetical protein